ncbi:uncharacterized protein LOC126984595 [Eriocheir sinensis]|uniref:uncharacterized protein LOC126984595 n=1 Tax=Eriocheir sinensis TaxID=95602 RepID=UPI0021C788A8|nr:uncharacterized protein LOC126984595 [Eriocheir sinensis]
MRCGPWAARRLVGGGLVWGLTAVVVEGATEDLGVDSTNAHGIELGEISFMQFLLLSCVFLLLCLLDGKKMLPIYVDLGKLFYHEDKEEQFTEEGIGDGGGDEEEQFTEEGIGDGGGDEEEQFTEEGDGDGGDVYSGGDGDSGGDEVEMTGDYYYYYYDDYATTRTRSRRRRRSLRGAKFEVTASFLLDCPLQFVCEVDDWANRDHVGLLENLLAYWFRNPKKRWRRPDAAVFGGVGSCQEMYPCPFDVQEVVGIRIPGSNYTSPFSSSSSSSRIPSSYFPSGLPPYSVL